jgi:mannitol 2-dehydrogenase
MVFYNIWLLLLLLLTTNTTCNNYCYNYNTSNISMVDRITPAASAAEARYASEVLGLPDAVPVLSETYRQWVIEDNFCNGRPDWGSVGAQLTDSVKPYEKIKVRLLNAGHSCLGYAGHLAGLATVDEACNDKLMARYLRRFFEEVSETLDAVPGMDIAAYQNVLIKRFSNVSIKDQILRICKDGSSKIPGFIIPTLRELLVSGKPRKFITFLVATYLHFLQRRLAEGGDAAAAIDDPEHAQLAEAVASSAGNVALFAAKCPFIFADAELKNPVFLQELQGCFDAIQGAGVRTALEGMLSE